MLLRFWAVLAHVLVLKLLGAAAAGDEQQGEKFNQSWSSTWQEDISRTARKLTDKLKIMPDEVDTFLTDKDSDPVRSAEEVPQERFPLQVQLVPWSATRLAQVRKFEIADEDSWQARLDKEMNAYQKLHKAERALFRITVWTKQGAPIEKGQTPTSGQFPLHIKFIPVGPVQKKQIDINDYDILWKDRVREALKEFTEELGIEKSQTGISVLDNKGATLTDYDFPEQDRFPIHARFMIHGSGNYGEEKYFEVGHSESWRDEVRKRMMEFSALHDTKPDRYKVSVKNALGKEFDPNEELEQEHFPVTVKFTPKNKKGKGKKDDDLTEEQKKRMEELIPRAKLDEMVGESKKRRRRRRGDHDGAEL